jgi:hypothetical protein
MRFTLIYDEPCFVGMKAIDVNTTARCPFVSDDQRVRAEIQRKKGDNVDTISLTVKRLDGEMLTLETSNEVLEYFFPARSGQTRSPVDDQTCTYVVWETSPDDPSPWKTALVALPYRKPKGDGS